MNTKKDFPLQEFYADIYPSYDRVNRLFTFGRDRAWRKKAVNALLETKPVRVLDLCTGTGDFILETALQDQGRASLHAFDFSSEMLGEAGRKLQLLKKENPGISEVDFRQGDAADMPYPDAHFDALGITFGIRNLLYENTRSPLHLKEINRVLKNRGILVVLESSRPGSPVWRLMNSIYLRLILPYLGGWVSGNLKAYKYLASSSRNYYTSGEMTKILESAGFNLRTSKRLFLGSVMLLVMQKNSQKSYL